MKKLMFVFIITGLTVTPLSALAADAMTTMKDGVVTITLPPETVAFKPGPNVDAAKTYCTMCHSADYIYNQPPMNKEKWVGIVTKMQKTFGAPVPDAEIDKIAEYLVSQNGKK